MKKAIFIAQGMKRINPVFFAAATLALAGCSSPSEKQYSLAPPPPAFDPYAPVQENFGPPVPAMMAFANSSGVMSPAVGIYGSGLESEESWPSVDGEKNTLKSAPKEKACSIRDRFDRDALVAYQWGRNRIALDIDGLNWQSRQLEEIKLEYKLRLQDYKTRKEKCRYESGWQGMIGSGYNELFLRDKDTVYDQIKKIRNDVDDGMDKLF